MKLTLNLEPVPLARPRVNTTNRGRYLPAKSRKFQDDLKAIVRANFSQQPFENPLSVTLHFYRPRKTTAQNFGDIDNLAKAVLDACNGIIWQDDRQIEELHAFKHKGKGKIILEVIDIGDN